MALSEASVSYIKKELDRYESRLSAIIPALFKVQEEKGWIETSDIEELSRVMDIPSSSIQEVATFYTMFNKKETGKYHIQVCCNITCAMKKSRELTDYICNKLNVKDGEVTKDGLFTVSRVECLGSCDTAPVMQVNFDYHENLDEKKVDQIIEGLKK